MAISYFHFPAQLCFGLGALGALRDLQDQAGLARPLAVCDRDLQGTATSDRVLQRVGPHVFFPATSANASQDELLDGAELYVTEQCNGLIAIGSAAAIELAKGIRLKVTHPLSLSDYENPIGGAGRITPDLPPLLAVPTLAGACTAVSPSLVVTVDRFGRRAVIASPHLIPTAVIQDPELSLDISLPVLQHAALSALAQNLDLYVCPSFHPISDAVALDGSRLILEALPALNENARNLDAIARLIWGAILAAIAADKGSGKMQAIAHLLHSHYPVPFGQARLLLIAAGSRIADEFTRSRVQVIERHTGTAALADRLRELAMQCHLPHRLRDWRIAESALDSVATEVGADARNAHLWTRDQLAALLRAAW